MNTCSLNLRPFPVRAGVILVICTVVQITPTVPRTRGGDPVRVEVLGQVVDSIVRVYWSWATSQVVGVDSIVRRTRRGRGGRGRPIGRSAAPGPYGCGRGRGYFQYVEGVRARRRRAGDRAIGTWSSRATSQVVEVEGSGGLGCPGRGLRLRFVEGVQVVALARLVDCIVRVYWSRPAPVRRGRAVVRWCSYWSTAAAPLSVEVLR